MSEYIFLFDLDSTITCKEILPTIAEKVNRQKEMRELTEATMNGEIPFKSSFLKRVEILSVMNVSETRAMVAEIPLNENIAQFIRENRDRCYVVTGNLDIWINDLMRKLGLNDHVYCSRANYKNDKITQIVSVIDKELLKLSAICRLKGLLLLVMEIMILVWHKLLIFQLVLVVLGILRHR